MEVAMRMMLKMTMDTQTASRAAEDGSLPEVQRRLFGALKPEAAYFAPAGGRTSFLVFDLNDPSDIPGICEPLFRKLNAQIEMFPVMNMEELQRGLEQAGLEQVV
jgi:hypothetical protein